MIRTGDLDRAQRSRGAAAGQYVIDSNDWRKPPVGREGGLNPCPGLLGRIPIAIAQQTAKWAHVDGAVQVSRNDYSTAARPLGDLL